MAEPVQAEQALTQRDKFEKFVGATIHNVIAALPLSVPEEQLKRARTQFRVAFTTDPKGDLMRCTPESVAKAIVLSAISGLHPGGPRPDIWLIPRKNRHNNNLLECNWQMAFRGYVRLARRAGYELEPVLVFDGERYEIEEGVTPVVRHWRDLNVARTWDSLIFGYIRVYPTGRREQTTLAYLTKAEIQKRRNKAQDPSIWNEWPLEQSYKTLCSYAGAREMFPTDDPSRYVMVASESSEIGAPTSTQVAVGGVRNLEQRLLAPSQKAEVESEGRVVDFTPLQPEVVDAGGSGEETQAQTTKEPVHLTSDSLAKLKELASSLNVSWDEKVVAAIGPPEEYTLAGVSEGDLFIAVSGKIREMGGGKGKKGDGGLFQSR